MNVTCENHFCVYWSEDICTLGKISLDALGACTDCIHVELREREARWEKETPD